MERVFSAMGVLISYPWLGVAISALHFYEREGLITSRRTSGNQRRYARDALRRVAFIRMSQRLGIPLAKVRQALATLPDERVPTSRDWARLSAGWRQDLDDRIVHLQRLRDNLADCIGCGCLSLERCSASPVFWCRTCRTESSPRPRRN